MYITSLIFGIIAIITCFIPFFNVAVAFISLIIAIAAMCIKKPNNEGKGMKIAGLVLSILAFVIALVVTGIILLGAKYIADNNEEIIKDAQETISEYEYGIVQDMLNLEYADLVSNSSCTQVCDEYGNIIVEEYYYDLLAERLGDTVTEIKSKYIITIEENGIPKVTKNEGSNLVITNKQPSNNVQNPSVDKEQTLNDTKQSLTKEELQNIEEFLNKGYNNPFAQITYSNPSDLFNNKNALSTSYYLKYAIQLSEYSEALNKEQLKELYGDQEQMMKVYGTKIEDVIKFLKETMNYTYSVQTLKTNAGNYINEKANLFITKVSDTIMCPLDVVSGYKYNGKIYIDVNSYSFVQQIGSWTQTELLETRTITLTEDNGNYYFYACEGIKGY